MAFSMAVTGDAQAKKKKHQSNLRNFNRTSTVAQQPTTFVTAASNPLTATPYTFKQINKPKTVNNVSVIVNLAALNTNDTGLFLGLDGIDTGIPLQGFTNNVNFTATGTPINGNQIAKAAADGQLVGTIIDRTPNDNIVAVNNNNTTLTIKGKRRS
ncbi:MAG: serralysin [Rubrobacteraceae bacterium]|nr:serralysin [Rubrobacteraceae bacterium]